MRASVTCSRGGDWRLLSNVPIFPQLPFSVIGSLNGVHMFGQNLEVQLSSARTEDTTVVWKSFHDRSPSRILGTGPG